MKLSMISEGRERADAIRDDIRSGKHSFRYLSKKYGVSIPYISACAKRMGLGRGGKPLPPATGGPSGVRPNPMLATMPSLGVVRGR